MRLATAVLAATLTAAMWAAPAHADDGPDGDGSGAFSPSFEHSPVTVVLCLTKDACPNP